MSRPRRTRRPGRAAGERAGSSARMAGNGTGVEALSGGSACTFCPPWSGADSRSAVWVLRKDLRAQGCVSRRRAPRAISVRYGRASSGKRRSPQPPANRGSRPAPCRRTCSQASELEAKLDRIEYVTSHSRCAVSRSTSSDRCRSGRVTARPGPGSPIRCGCPRPTTARTASATSTAATASATTNSGASLGAARRGPLAVGVEVHPGRQARRGTDLRDHGQPVGEQDSRGPGMGRTAQGRTWVALRATAHMPDCPLR